MPAFLLPLLGKLAPYLAMVVAAVTGYFVIKHKGAVAEREKIQKQQTAAVEKRTEEVRVAINKDAVIDHSVGEKVHEIQKHVQTEPAKAPSDYKPGDIFKF